MRWSWLLLLALVGCDACGEPEADDRVTQKPTALTVDCAGHYWIESGFRVDQAEAIERAMGRWNALIGREHFRVEPEARCRILVSTEVGDTPFKPTEQWGAFADGYTGRIVVNLESLAKTGFSGGWRFESIVMHELGHSAGLAGLTTAPGIMGEDRGLLAKDFTDADRAECRRVQFCH